MAAVRPKTAREVAGKWLSTAAAAAATLVYFWHSMNIVFVNGPGAINIVKT
jgi:hypothetical protein